MQPHKYEQKQAMAKLHLRGDDKDGPLSPGHLSALGERQNPETGEYATGPSRFLNSSLSSDPSYKEQDITNPFKPEQIELHNLFNIFIQ
jgi:chemotaxis protein CheY-P-specific phosphatase CheC